MVKNREQATPRIVREEEDLLTVVQAAVQRAERPAQLPDYDRAGAAGPRAGDVIKVDPGTKYQAVLGFGAALTDASCWLFSKLPAAKRAKLFAELFSKDGLGLTVHRVCVGASDYARTSYHFDETPDDFELKDFSTAHDQKYIIPMIAEAQAANPDTFLFSSPWSPPGWMKAPDTFFGGWMREKHIEVYSRYYLQFLKDYAAAGVAMQALTPQNEVETDQSSKMPACYWHPEYEAALVRDHLGPAIENEGLGTKIWLLDHNYDLWRRVKWQLDDPALKKYTEGVAFHGYGGTPDMMTKLHDAHPDMNLYWTEGGPHMNKTYATEWCHWGRQITEVLRNWCRSYTGWNYALDENGTPNIGPFKCLGMVTIGSQDKKISYSAQYWALAHFSRYFTPGSVRVASAGEIKDVAHVAGVDPSGRRVLTITNSGKARAIKVREGKQEAKLKLPADSLVTLRLGSLTSPLLSPSRPPRVRRRRHRASDTPPHGRPAPRSSGAAYAAPSPRPPECPPCRPPRSFRDTPAPPARLPLPAGIPTPARPVPCRPGRGEWSQRHRPRQAHATARKTRPPLSHGVPIPVCLRAAPLPPAPPAISPRLAGGPDSPPHQPPALRSRQANHHPRPPTARAASSRTRLARARSSPQRLPPFASQHFDMHRSPSHAPAAAVRAPPCHSPMASPHSSAFLIRANSRSCSSDVKWNPPPALSSNRLTIASASPSAQPRARSARSFAAPASIKSSIPLSRYA